MRSLTISLALLLVVISAACVPTQSATQPTPALPTAEPPVGLVTVAPPTATVPPPIVATAEAPTPADEATAQSTESFIPIIESQPSPTPSATPLPTATPLPSPLASVRLEPFVSGGLTRPLYVTHAFDDRVFIIEQPGLIRVVDGGQLLADPFMDLRDRVGSFDNEQGLLGLAFDPGYQDPAAAGYRKFYVNYTDYSGNTVVSQFSAQAGNPQQGDKSSEIVLLRQKQPYGNHNGGQLLFGPDGYLYIALGDGGSANDPENRAQNLGTWLGKLLRIDVSAGDGSYRVPDDNPFVNQPGVLPEIWAYGLRNPWRLSFDRLTGALFMGDVGQNLYEELNYMPYGSGAGANYGWRIMEGSHCFNPSNCSSDGLVLPILEYDHSNGCSVTGGYIYRGRAYPQMAGNYFAADYCLGTIWRIVPTADGGWDADMILDSDLVISSFGEDYAGELYVTDHARGAVYRIVTGG